MRVAVVGSRGYPDLTEVSAFVDALPEGVDAIAEARARLCGLEVEVVRPDYGGYPGRKSRYAPIVRNEEIVRRADEVVVFWDGKSTGSGSVIAFAKRQGKSLTVRRPPA